MLSEHFRAKAPHERMNEIAQAAFLTKQEATLLNTYAALDEATANRMIENAIGTFDLPMGIAWHFVINGKQKLIPMVIEEPSVVAAASHAAKLCLPNGFSTNSTEPVMIGQIQIVNVSDVKKAQAALEKNKNTLIAAANAKDPTMVSRGGGAIDIQNRVIKTSRGDMLILDLLVNVQDAMGANAINTMCEAISPDVEKMTDGNVRLRILSNLSIHRTATAKAVWTKEALEKSAKGAYTGEQVIDRMLDADAFAHADVFRATTANKGIMNGVDAVVLATGNDWRAMEAAAHGIACYGHAYAPLTRYHKTKNGDLAGEITLPAAVGIVGGATKTHPLAKLSLKILNVKTARELAEVLAAVGLAQNFAAMRALCTTGIQQGHMRLHAKNIAIAAGATGKKIDEISEQMALEKNVSVARAKELLENKA